MEASLSTLWVDFKAITPILSQNTEMIVETRILFDRQ